MATAESVKAYIRSITDKRPVTDDTKLGDLGIGASKCKKLQLWVNSRRVDAGKKPLKDGTIKPSTTVGQVVKYVTE